MTKALAGVASLLALLLTAPVALAHGASPPREIDTRIFADNDGLVPFGGCAEGQCLPGLESQGLDLVVLEVREAAFPTGDPAVIFRTVYQTSEASEGRTVTISFKAAGKDHTYQFATDGSTAPTGDFDLLTGPEDAFDGFPKAVDGWLKYSTLGVKTGDQLTNIAVTSSFEGEPSDITPGTWFASGQEVPFVPNPEGELEQPPPGSYTLAGPAALLNVTATAPMANLTAGPATIKFTVTNPLTSFPQFVNLSIMAPAGVVATMDSASLNLEAGASRDVQLTINNATGAEGLHVLAVSDLGAFTMLPIGIKSPPMPADNMTHHMASTTTGHHAQGEEEDHDESSKDTPAPGLASVALLTVALTLVRRRR